jgi:malate dehydrogenase (quinone)
MAVRQADLVLVGGGVMSATLGMILKQLDPTMDIVLVERLDHIAHESTDGDVIIDRALQINAQFEVTLQFWSYLVE